MGKFKLPTWTLHFPRFKCPHCKRTIATAFYGGRFRFWAVGKGRPRSTAPFPATPTLPDESPP